MEQCGERQGGKRALVLDGGANMGFFSLAAASCGCDAVSYEPNPVCQQFIGASATINGFESNILRRIVAITDKRGPVNFDGWHTRAGGADSELPGVRVDEDVAEHHLEADHYILYFKVDIQGSEHDAIEGASALLKTRSIEYVAFEAQLNTQAGSAQAAFKKICAAGYECLDVSNPTAKISCQDPLQAYTATLGRCAGQCERYVMCAHVPAKVESMRRSIIGQLRKAAASSRE
jgi:FkbM family methyltransferase